MFILRTSAPSRAPPPPILPRSLDEIQREHWNRPRSKKKKWKFLIMLLFIMLLIISIWRTDSVLIISSLILLNILIFYILFF